jgi:DNA-binding NtrC family response regulator
MTGPLGGNVTGRTERTKVLVLARESVIAALIGMLLELEDYEPVFADAGERPEDAIHRHRPPLIVILDGDLDAAGSDLFYARASAAGASVVLFGEPLTAEEVRAVARQRRLPFLSMPTDRDSLGRILERTRAG